MGEYKARPHEIHLRLSEEEYRALEKNRAKCRLPQQTYLRKMCLDVQPKEQQAASCSDTWAKRMRVHNSNPL